MNSPSQRETPKRSFFFRTRTLSSSSNESGGGGSGGGGGGGSGSPSAGVLSSSPRVSSPRISIFDRVRKRSQSDAKSPPSLDVVSPTMVNGNAAGHSPHSVTTFSGLSVSTGSKCLNNNNSVSSNGSNSRYNSAAITGMAIVRKHLSHSISEEKDENSLNGDSCYSSTFNSSTNSANNYPIQQLSSSVKVNYSE